MGSQYPPLPASSVRQDSDTEAHNPPRIRKYPAADRRTADSCDPLSASANLPDATPEKITSFEFGYKSILLDNTLVVDLDAYVNQYKGFLGQVQVYVPNGVNVGTDAGVLAMLDRNRYPTTASGGNAASQGQSRYRVYTNAISTYYNWGSALAITYNFYKTYTINGNINFNNMG